MTPKKKTDTLENIIDNTSDQSELEYDASGTVVNNKSLEEAVYDKLGNLVTKSDVTNQLNSLSI